METYTVAPDGGWGWVITIATLINMTIAGGIGACFGVLLPSLIETFQETRFVIAWIAAIQSGASLLIAPLGSLLGNKIGFRLVAMMGTIIAAFGMFVSAFATHFAELYIAMGLIVGIGNGLVFLAGMVMVSVYFEEKRAISTGIAVTGHGVGLFLFGQLAPLLVETYTWRGTCIILSGMLLQNLVTSCLYRPLPEFIEPPPTDKPTELEKIEENKEMIPSGNVNDRMKKPSTGSRHVSKIENLGSQVNFTNSSLFLGSCQTINPQHVINSPDGKTFFRHTPSTILTGSGYIMSSVIDLNDILSTGRRASRDHGTMPGKSVTNMYITSLASVANVPLDEDKPRESCINLFCNFQIFRNPAVTLFMLANFLASFGFSPPFTYIIDKTLLMGFPESHQKMFLSTIGAFNCVGRLGFGFVANIRGMDKNIMFMLALFGMAVCNIVCQFCVHLWSLLVFCLVFGVCSGIVFMLQTVVLCDLVKIPSNLASALGMFMLIVSFSSIASIPMGGAIFDLTLSYDVVFWVCGLVLLASSLLCVPLPIIARRREARLQKLLEEEKEAEGIPLNEDFKEAASR